MNDVFRALIDALNPQGIKCVICGADARKEENGFCAKCRGKLPFNGRVCVRCGVDIKTMNDYCGECGARTPSFDEARSVCRYEGHAMQLIRRLKFNGQKYLARPLAVLMAETLAKQPWDFDAVTYVPMNKSGLKNRGYNQAELLTEEICDIIQKPMFCGMAKKEGVIPQEGLDYNGRKDNVKGAFLVTEKPPERLLLVDDVKTTGATLGEAAGVAVAVANVDHTGVKQADVKKIQATLEKNGAFTGLNA